MSVNLGSLFYELGIEDNTKKDLADAKRKVERWERDTAATVQVDADWDRAQAALKAAGKAVGGVDGMSATVLVDGDGTGAEKAIASVGSSFDDLRATVDGNPIEPRVDVDKIDDGAAEGRVSLLDMIGGWTTAAVAAAALGGAAIADKMIEGFNGALEANLENDRLAASLGLSPDEATEAGRIAGDLWVDAFGESTGQVNEAVRAALQARENIGTVYFDEDGGIRTVTEDALNLASIFDVDVTDSITTAAQLVRNGLAPSMSAAFDLMVASMQQVPATMTGDLIDAANEYGPLIATLGLSGEEFFGMLVAQSSNGTIAVDKVGDALKELTIRGTDMSKSSSTAYSEIGLRGDVMANKLLAGGKTAREGFNEIIDGLLAIEDPATQANTAIALFGTPLEDLGAAKIPGFLRSMKEGAGGLGDFEGAAKDAGATLNDNLATDIEEVVRKLSPASLAAAFDQGGIEGVKARVQEGVDKLKSIWEEYGPAVTELVSTSLDELSKMWDEKGPEIIGALSRWWSESGSPAAEAAISAAVGVAWEGAQAYFKEKVTDPGWWAGLVHDGIVSPFQQEMTKKGPEMLVYLVAWLDQAPGFIAEKAAGLWDPIADGFEAVINHIIDGWNSLSFTIPGFDGLTVMGQEIVPGWDQVTIGNPVQIPHVNIPGGGGAGARAPMVGGQHAPPAFEKGGFVDAPIGKALLAVVHGGEYVNTADEVRQGRIGAPGNRAGRRSHGFRDLHVHTGGNPTVRAVADAADRRLMGWS